MRTSNNTKRMLATRVLGLFLTAALPLSASISFTDTAIAAETGALGLGEIIEAIKPKEFKRIDVSIPGEGQEEEQYNYGMATHHLRDLMLVDETPAGKKEAEGRVNKFLAHLNKGLEVNNSDDFIALWLESILQNFTTATALIHAKTHETSETAVKEISLMLERASVLYDWGIVASSYSGLLTQLRTDNQAVYNNKKKELDVSYEEKEKELRSDYDATKSTFDAEYQILAEDIAKEQAKLLAEYEEVQKLLKYQINTPITGNLTESVVMDGNNSIRADLEKRLKESEEKYKEEKQKLDDKLAQRKQEIREALEAKETAKDKTLSEQKLEDAQALETLATANQAAEVTLRQKLEVIFRELGKTPGNDTWLGSAKNLASTALYGPFKRQDPKHYLELNKMLQEKASVLKKSKATLISALFDADLKALGEAGKINLDKNYSLDVIKTVLQKFLGITETDIASVTTKKEDSIAEGLVLTTDTTPVVEKLSQNGEKFDVEAKEPITTEGASVSGCASSQSSSEKGQEIKTKNAQVQEATKPTNTNNCNVPSAKNTAAHGKKKPGKGAKKK